jgi:hypothetical protein
MARRLLITAAVAAALVYGTAAVPGAAGAAVVAVGDQNAASFSQPLWTSLGLRNSRVFTPWNVTSDKRERRRLDTWLRLARQAGVKPLVAFNPSRGSRCPSKPCRLPSVRAFRKAFRAFRRRYPRVKNVSPWNEANHRSQPTFKNPRRAAEYFNVVRLLCRGCRIVAADVIDEPNMVSWLRVFKRHAVRPRLWGLHNYRDVNPRGGQITGGTRKLLRAVRGQVWLTETGGIVKFVLPSGSTLFPYDEARARRAVRQTFKIAKRHRRRIKRVYLYHFLAPPPSNRFDAGLVSNGGKARPAYRELRDTLRKQRRYFKP